MKKNEEYVVEISGYTTEGFALAKLDSFVLFIPGLLRGEKARVALTKVKKTYAFARVIEILEVSEKRVKPSCSIARLCGGCQLQHMAYQEQLSLKQEIVQIHFLRHQLDLNRIHPILPSPKQERYRNKVQVPIQEKDGLAQLGFYRNHSHDVVVYEDCMVETEESNQITHFVKRFLNQHHLTSNFRYLFIRHIHQRNEVMVMPIVREYPFEKSKKLALELVKEFPNITSFLYLRNPKETNVILDGPIFEVIGPLFLEESLLGMNFQLSAKSFFQVNPYATEVLYLKALELADISKEDTVVDLYCGTGTIGILASKIAKKVIGIEIVPEAIDNAKANAQLNCQDNLEFWCMDAQDGAKKIVETKESIDVVIVDPPRKGCSLETLQAIQKMEPKKTVYISCDPSTLARDLEFLQSMGFKVETVQPVDLFPQTVHVETVALLSKLDIDKHIEVEIKLDELDLTSAESKASYAQIKEYILEKFDLKVSTLYIAQIKKKCGIVLRENYNKSKKEKQVIPQCTPEKEEAIMDALRHFKMI